MPLISSTLKIGNNAHNSHDNIMVEGEFVGNLIPNTTLTYDIGSTSKFWNNLYINNITTSITSRQILYSESGVVTGSSTLVFEGNGSALKRMSLGTSGFYGKFCIYDSSPAPVQAGTPYYGNTSNYQLNIAGGNATGWSTGISFGYMADVGASIIQKNVGSYSQSDLLFLTKSSSVSGVDPEVRMTLKSDGKLGIGVEEPFANLEVLASVGISNVNTGGELQFRKNGITATNTQDIGHIRFGTDSYTQSSVFSNATENWVAGSAHGTSVTISATPKGSTTESPIAYFDHSGSSIQSDWSVTGGVTATTYAGDGSALTGLAEGSNRQIQYNNNGNLGGSTLYFTSSGTYTLGTSGAYSRLFVYNAATYPKQNLGSMSSYHLGLGGSTTTGRGVGIAFGNTNNVGASIAWEDIGTFIGDMIFYVKQSTTAGVAPVERLRITHDGKVCLSEAPDAYELNTKGDIGLLGSSTVAPAIKTFTSSQYPVAGSSLGRWTAGSNDFPDQGYFTFDNKSNWTSSSRDTRLSLFLTAYGSTNPTRVALFDGNGLNLTGTVVADYFKGDGSQITNLPSPPAQGANANIQFNANGVFDGAGFFNYYSATGGVTLGTSSNAQDSGFMVNLTTLAPASTPTDVTEYAYVSRYGNATGASTGIGFYDTTKVTGNFLHLNYGNGTCATAFYVLEANALTNYLTLGLGKIINNRPIEISTTQFNGQTVPLLNIQGSALVNQGASIHLSASAYPTAIIRTNNLGSYGYGMLEFLLEEDQNTGTTPQMYLQMGQGKSEFLRTVGINTDNEPNENPQTPTAHQLYLKGNNYSSVGLSMGSPNGVAWSIHTNIESVTNSKQGDLLFKKPSTGTSNTYVDILTLTTDGDVKVTNSMYSQTATIGTGVASTAHGEYLQVQNEASVAGGNGGFLRLRKNANSYSYIDSGDTLGEISFGSGTFSPLTPAKIIGVAKNNWALNNYPSEMEFWTTDTDGFVKRMTVSDKIEAHKQIIATNGLYSQYSTVEAKYTKGQYARHQYYQNLSGEHMFAHITGSGSVGDAIWINWGSSDLDFRVQDNNGDSVLMMDAGDGCVILGTPHGEATVDSEYDLLNNSRGSVFVQGMTDSSVNNGQGCVMAISNLSDGTAADGLGIILGRDVQASFGFTSGIFGWQQTSSTSYTGYPETSNGYVNFYYRNYNGSTWVTVYAGGCRGDGSGGVSFYSSFTGQHATVTELQETHKIGMIMISTGEIWHGTTMTTALPRTTPTDTPKDKRVFGVLATKEGGMEGYTTASPPRENETQVEVNSIGEGRILVTNIGGNIENGDYICSSEILGYGMLQDDDLLHNYTVAKCTENINWDDPNLEIIEHNGQTYKVYLAACTYHCG